MARRGENIFKRKDNRWEGRYKKGRNSNGKLIYGYVYGKSYYEVKKKLIEFKYQYNNSIQEIHSYNGTVSDWSTYHMSEVVATGIKPSTYAYYHCMLQNHILPYFRHKKLISLTKNDIEGFVFSLSQKGLNAGSVRSVFGILNRMLKKAVSQKILLANPCAEVALPKKEKSKIDILNSTEQFKLEQAALNDKYGMAVILALYTGMRIGEISALKWEDIDFETGIIHVKETVQRVQIVQREQRTQKEQRGQIMSDQDNKNKTEIVFNNPKSECSNRLIPLPENIKNLLIFHKSKSRSKYVVTSKNSFAEPRVIRYRYNKIIKQAGVKYVPFHSLRHSFATRCMELHIDVTSLSQLLGHSSVKMTLDVYTDSMLEQRILAMQKLNKLFTHLPIGVDVG